MFSFSEFQEYRWPMGFGARVRILILVLGLFGSHFAAALQPWSYFKSDIQDFLHAWRIQTEQDHQLPWREKDLRTDFIDHLLVKVDASYHGDKLEELMTRTCQDLGQPLLAQAISEVMEPTENLLLFMRSYVEYASLSSPPPDLEDYIESRSYSNTVQFESAGDALDADQAGQAAADAVDLAPIEFESEQNLIESEPLHFDSTL